MRRLAIAALLLVGLAGLARGQGYGRPSGGPNYGPGYRPQLSPYLNLIRGGNAGANFYLGTIPEIQRRQNAAQFRSEIADLQRRTAPEQEDYGELPPIQSGTTPFLANTGGYFGNTGGYFPPVGGPRQSSNLGGAPQRGPRLGGSGRTRR